MAYKSLRMDQIMKIIEFHSKGVPKKKIARLLGLSKNTVKKYLDMATTVPSFKELCRADQEAVMYGQSVKQSREEVLKQLMPGMMMELHKKGVTRYLLWEEYKQAHPDGFSYGRYCERIKRYKLIQSATIRIEHEPAYHMMVDYAGKKINWIDRRSGEVIACEVLVCVLPYSQYTFACAVASQKQEDFITAITRATSQRNVCAEEEHNGYGSTELSCHFGRR